MELSTFDRAFTPTIEAPPRPSPAKRPTPQQEALYAAVSGSDSHIAVEAVAGAGKTTSAVGAASVARGKVGFVAFNKHIAAELQARLAGTAKACTLHSLGYAAVRKAFPGCATDEKKPERLLERLRPRWCTTTSRGRVIWYDEGKAALALARLARLTLADEGNPDALAALAGHYGVELPDRGVGPAFEAARDLVRECASHTAVIDFDDMVWLPVRHRLPVEPFDVLMVDEAQDLNRAQQELARRAATAGRLIPIGDRRQSLYGFTGADPEALPRLIGALGSEPRGCLSRPLTVTFRCPESHVELARKIVPQIEARPGAPAGKVHHVGEDDVPGLARPGDLVVCRVNAPLVSLTFALLARNVPAVMLGRDFAKGLTDLIDRLRAATPRELIAKARAWLETETERLEKKDAPDSQIQAATDRGECVTELAALCPTVDDVRRRIASLFAEASDPAKVVTLASVHRAKGSEADRVFIARPDRMPLVRPAGNSPSKRRPPKPWEMTQELNLIYVAVTRARKELTFAGPMPSVLL